MLAEKKVTFAGIRKRVSLSTLDADSFTTLAAGQSIELSIDVASVHDLSTGGAFSALSQGVIPYAPANSTTLSGAVSYLSNTLDLNVDGAAAAKVVKAIDLVKRTDVSSDCTGSKLTSTENALDNCVDLANAAAADASSGATTDFLTYFKSSSERSTVVSCLNSVADECGSTTSGSTETHCTDLYSGCSSNVLAYTVPSVGVIVNCPLYFSALPALTSSCHAQDQATTTLHEMTHAVCGTDDLGYGYSAATQLSASQAVNNADSYALYANGELSSQEYLNRGLTNFDSDLRRLLNVTWTLEKKPEGCIPPCKSKDVDIVRFIVHIKGRR